MVEPKSLSLLSLIELQLFNKERLTISMTSKTSWLGYIWLNCNSVDYSKDKTYWDFFYGSFAVSSLDIYLYSDNVMTQSDWFLRSVYTIHALRLLAPVVCSTVDWNRFGDEGMVSRTFAVRNIHGQFRRFALNIWEYLRLFYGSYAEYIFQIWSHTSISLLHFFSFVFIWQ